MPAYRLPRILLMLALLLMPLAMAGQGHAVAAAPHHQMAASAQEDCHQAGKPEQRDERQQSGAAQCMMACAALPASEAPPREEAEALRPSLYALPIVPISGLAPEATTPPPRIA